MLKPIAAYNRISDVDGDESVIYTISKRCLLGIVLQLNVYASREQSLNEGSDASGVVVPSASVHIGAVFQSDRRRVLIGDVQSVELVVRRVGAGHGSFACFVRCPERVLAKGSRVRYLLIVPM